MAVPYASSICCSRTPSFTRYARAARAGRGLAGVKGVAWLSPLAALVPAGAALSVAGDRRRHADADRIRREPAPAVQAVGRDARRSGQVARPGRWPCTRPSSGRSRRRLVGVHPQLPSPPRREWLELAKYWSEGHDGVVWFLADPRRTDLALDRSAEPPRRRPRFRWAPSARPVFGGMRPAGRGLGADRPARLVRRGRLGAHPGDRRHGPADGPRAAPRPDHGAGAPRSGAARRADRRRPQPRRRQRIPPRASRWPSTAARSISGTRRPGFFLRTIDLPPGALAGDGPLAALTDPVDGGAGEAVIPTAIEQFDCSRRRR